MKIYFQKNLKEASHKGLVSWSHCPNRKIQCLSSQFVISLQNIVSRCPMLVFVFNSNCVSNGTIFSKALPKFYVPAFLERCWHSLQTSASVIMFPLSSLQHQENHFLLHFFSHCFSRFYLFLCSQSWGYMHYSYCTLLELHILDTHIFFFHTYEIPRKKICKYTNLQFAVGLRVHQTPAEVHCNTTPHQERASS